MQLNLKINFKKLEKNKVNAESLRENYNEFIKHNKLVLKAQERFKSERHNFLLKK